MTYVHKQKRYCFRKECYEVDAGLSRKHLDIINKNDNIVVYGTCEGHSKKEPARIYFFSETKNLCETLRKQIPDTTCTKTKAKNLSNKNLQSYVIKSKENDYRKWWKNAHKVLGKI